MSNTISLKAEQRRRNGTADVRRLRREGLIPAVVYGKGVDNLNLKIDERSFTRLMQEQETDNILVDLDIDGEGSSHLALVQNIQYNPLNGRLLHVDFMVVSDAQEITADVPLHLDGTPTGVRQGGVFDQLMHSLEVRCVPSRLPANIEVDISNLAIGSTLHVSDLNLGEGVAAVLDGNVVVAQVSAPRGGLKGEEGEAAAEAEPTAEGEESPADVDAEAGAAGDSGTE